MKDYKYILISASEDGAPNTFLTEEDYQEMLTGDELAYGNNINEFYSAVPDEDDSNYWPEDKGLLVKIEVVVPQRAGRD